MKKFSIIILSIIVCFSTIGCSCKKEQPIILVDSQYIDGKGNIKFLETFDLIQEKIDVKSNFVFYMYGATCSGCHKFTPILQQYVEEKGINMYAVEVNVVSSAKRHLAQTLGCTPAVAIMKNGELYKYIGACEKGQAEYFLSVDGFGEWFETYIELK